MRWVKRALMAVGIVFVLFVGLAVYVSYHPKTGTDAPVSAGVATAPPLAASNASAEDVAARYWDAPSASSPLAPRAVVELTLKELVFGFADNQLAMEDRIAGRAVRTRGMIQTVEKDDFGRPVVAFVTDNEFMPARMTLWESERARAVELRRGQVVGVVCQAVRYELGRPAGKGCRLK